MVEQIVSGYYVDVSVSCLYREVIKGKADAL